MSKWVLIADDSVLIRRMIAEVLTQAGWEVVGEASNGAEAVAVPRVESRRGDFGHRHARNRRNLCTGRHPCHQPKCQGHCRQRTQPDQTHIRRDSKRRTGFYCEAISAGAVAGNSQQLSV